MLNKSINKLNKIINKVKINNKKMKSKNTNFNQIKLIRRIILKLP